MPATTKTETVTYISQSPNLRVGRVKFEQCRYSTSDPKEIERLDAGIAKGGRCLYEREDRAAEPEPKDTGSGAKVEPVDWSKFSATDLKNHAAKAGITGTGSMKKDELISALEGTDYRPG